MPAPTSITLFANAHASREVEASRECLSLAFPNCVVAVRQMRPITDVSPASFCSPCAEFRFGRHCVWLTGDLRDAESVRSILSRELVQRKPHP